MLAVAGIVAWIFGIGTSGYLSPNILVFILTAIFLLAVIVIHGLRFAKEKRFSQSLLRCLKLLMCLGLFLLGNWYHSHYVATSTQRATDFANENPTRLCGMVTSEVQTYNGTSYFSLTEDNGLKISVKIRTEAPILCGQRVCLYDPILTPVNPANNKIQATRKLIGNNTFLSATFPYQAVCQTDGIGNYPLYWGKKLRLATAERLKKIFPSDIAHFLTALLSSDRAEMPDELYDRFLATGTVHIVVVSGMHFNYLMASLLFLLSFFFPSLRKRMLLSFLILVGFVIYTGATLPVLRSFLMMSAGFFCDFFYIKPQQKRTTVLYLFGLFLLVTPTLISNPSFLLSFGASYGLCSLGQPIEQKLSRLPLAWLRSYLATCSSVWIMTFPILLLYFGKIPFISIIANFLVAPLVAPILLLSVASLAVYNLPLISAIVILLERCLSALFLWFIKRMAAVPFSLNFFLKDATFVLLMSATIGLSFSVQIRREVKKQITRIAAIFLLILAISAQYYTPSSARMLITFFGASNTNSVAVFTPADKLILYGSGTDLIYGQASGAYRENQPIELLIFTSLPNPDAMSEFFKTHPTKRVILPQIYRGVFSHHPNIQWIQEPMVITIDDVAICLNTDGSTILEAEFSYANQPISLTQSASYLVDHLERNPKKNWIFNFSRSSRASSELKGKSVPTKLFSKKQWHPDVLLCNHYSIIQADVSGVRLLTSAEQEP